MTLRRLGRFLGVPFVCVAVALAGQSAASATPPGTTYYVALGDSLSQGFMPLTGNSNEGYVDQIYAQLHQSQPQLQLVKLGCSGSASLCSRSTRASKNATPMMRRR